MVVIRNEKKLCVCCMEEHNVQTVRVDETTIYKGKAVTYSALYEYCDRADEYIATEAMLSQNHTAMQEAYLKTPN